MKIIKHVRNALLPWRLTCLDNRPSQRHFTAVRQFWVPLCSYFSSATVPCCIYSVGDWCKQTPDTRTGLSGALVLPFQEQQEGLTMQLLRLLPFCAEALKRRHSASFSSSRPRWVFYRELLKSLGTYRANSLMGCWVIDWWLCLSRCCKSCSGVTLAHIKNTPRYYAAVLSYSQCTNLLSAPSFACTVPRCKK